MVCLPFEGKRKIDFTKSEWNPIFLHGERFPPLRGGRGGDRGTSSWGSEGGLRWGGSTIISTA